MNKKIKVNLNEIDKIKNFVKIARMFKSDIDIMTDRAVVDAKSILGIYALDLSQNTYVKIISDDIDEYKEFEKQMKEFE